MQLLHELEAEVVPLIKNKLNNFKILFITGLARRIALKILDKNI